MERSRWLVVVLALVVGCDSKKKEGEAPSPSASQQPRFDGPMPITFGDCAPSTVAWVSGPRPLQFTPAQAEAQTKLAVASPSTTQDDPPPPPDEEDPPPPEEEDTDEPSGGTGTAMILEEGKMGKKDSDRAEGQYQMKRNQVDPQLARKQAIEQARTAGILGSATLAKGGTLTGTGGFGPSTDRQGGLLGNDVGEMNGGFGYGRSGFGPGGRSTGWGTIGTGRYGKIGHGAGTGTGYGVGSGRGGMRGRAASVPTVSIGQPSAVGDLDKAIIRRYIKRNHQKILYCYEKQLLVKPKISGTITTSFFIAPSGKVVNAQGNGVDPEVSKCVAEVIKGIEFPKPTGGGGVQVNYPFTFRPSLDAEPITDTPTAAPTAPLDPDPPAPAAGSAAPKPDPSVFRGPDPSGLREREHVPGASNPLREAEKAIVECLRGGSSRAGVLVVDFSAEKATVHGVTEDKVATCIVDATKRVKRVPERCSLAFGELPASGLPGIEITGTRAKLVNVSGKLETDLATESRTTKALVDAVKSRVDAAAKAVVTLHGPLAIRAAAATPMSSVDAVVASIVEAGDDFIFAVEDKGSWRPFAPMTFPLPPVPIGTGGRWNRSAAAPRPSDSSSDDDLPVVVSILVGKDKTWVGLSRVMEIQEVPTAELAKHLPTILAAHKKSAYFAERTDIEIAGDADGTYGSFLQTIELAVAAGFVDWHHMPPSGLSVRFTQ